MRGSWVLGICLTVLLVLASQHGATAGRNADGALILHTNDAYTYSSGTRCTTPLARPATCEEAITRSDKAVRPVVWALWAFDSLATPAVTAVYFGLEMDEVCIDPSEIVWTWCSPTGVVPSQDVSAGWPGDGESATVAWPSAITENLFPFLGMRVDEELCGEPGAYISTSVNHVGGYAAFIDDSNPPETDLIEKFGTVRWYEEGENECPGSGDDAAGGEYGDDQPDGGGWIPGDSQALGNHLPCSLSPGTEAPDAESALFYFGLDWDVQHDPPWNGCDCTDNEKDASLAVFQYLYEYLFNYRRTARIYGDSNEEVTSLAQHLQSLEAAFASSGIAVFVTHSSSAGDLALAYFHDQYKAINARTKLIASHGYLQSIWKFRTLDSWTALLASKEA